MVIGIIGGGASGMAAALAAAENENNQILLFERQARLGRKLSATGNGRCNLTNLHADEGGYHGNSPEFADYALGTYDVSNTLAWFRDMGLFTVAEVIQKQERDLISARSILICFAANLQSPRRKI